MIRDSGETLLSVINDILDELRLQQVLINLMGSDIVVSSEEKGSTFSFSVNISSVGDEVPVRSSEKNLQFY